MPCKQVVFGLLGTRLDRGHSGDRWNSWRPTVALCQHEDLLIDRLELLYEPKLKALAELTAKDIASVSPETDVRLHEVGFRDPWDLEEVYGRLHEFVGAYQFKPDGEDYLINITTGSHVQQICLFLLAESRRLPGKLLQASPPKRNKPGIGTYRVIDLDLSRYDQLAARFALEQQQGVSFLKSGIETRNAGFNKLIEQIERVAIHSAAPLLITGPTGAGKSQLARRIFELKLTRRHLSDRFVEVNCATLRGDQAMSALFGHVKGAFTGATGAREGLIRAADGGMLFLDEIGELGPDEQAMLLRAIEEKRFLPVGADQEAQSDFQLIAGTNRDLSQEVADGRFREDLLARINLWTFRLPGLAERREDIEPNLDYELQKFAASTGGVVRINKEARARFLRFAEAPSALWKANFRDLNAAVTRMATLAAGGRIGVDLVDEESSRLAAQWRVPAAADSIEATLAGLVDAAQVDRFDQAGLAEAVCVCRQSKSLSEAGRRLFAVSRQAKANPNDTDRVRKLLARHGLSWTDVSGG
ncbi:Transcriptional regulatory protein ZraR [Posidoniimonas corsicana]|uniref:Transcriptional regulatory protein ZraR n=1 Tax=Posidoniimonas corsicana TaxID=1938618 RepID=A0A5C5VH04_9BACT|nr:RNA repair transcriptional activator RtcR [Posidoniimonas corsicana]TWT36995.1 Transcriptional regulatory protein ZraR [Posidoniimonas corsicana]